MLFHFVTLIHIKESRLQQESFFLHLNVSKSHAEAPDSDTYITSPLNAQQNICATDQTPASTLQQAA